MQISKRWIVLVALVAAPAVLLAPPVLAESDGESAAAAQEAVASADSSGAPAPMTRDESTGSLLFLPLGGGLLPPAPKEQCASCVGEGPWVDPFCTETRCPIHERNCTHYCTQVLNSTVETFTCTDGGHSLYCECADGTFQSCSC